MENKTFYNEILTEHNLHPYHKHKLEDANLVLEGVNPSCGDDIFLELKVEDGVVVDGAFEGDGCAISQASADMMLELVIGRSKEEALHLADLFLKMIKGSITEEEREELEEACSELFSLIASGVIKVDVAESQIYPLSEARRAHEVLESRVTQGSSLLLP